MGSGRGSGALSAVFLDRDGVLNDTVPRPGGARESPLRPDDVRLAAGAVEGVRALRAAGWALVGVSNQPAYAKGETSAEALDAVHQRVVALLGAEGLALDAWEYCRHHPEAVVDELRGPCDCRKPAPGLLLRAADRLGIDLSTSWMVGDTDADVLAGQAAGCATVLVTHEGSAHKRSGAVAPTHEAANLAECATLIGLPRC